MTPAKLLETIYLGDRACKSIVLDGWGRRVVVHVDVISRIRSNSGAWEFYTAEDIVDGQIVFSDVLSVRFSPSGPLPNDSINDISVLELNDSAINGPVYAFTLSIGSVDDAGDSTEVIVEINARDLYLLDPRMPTRELRE